MGPKLIKSLLLISFPFTILLCNSNSVKNTDQDVQHVEAFAREWQLPTNKDSIHSSFESELQFITTMQTSIMRSVRSEEISHDFFGDVNFYFKNRKGFCYDRAILMEKFFLHYGFSFRHLFLYFHDNNQSLAFINLAKKKTSSHALVEVKTKKGWMAIGTNADWIGLAPDNSLLAIKDIQEKLKTNTIALKYPLSVGDYFWNRSGRDFGYVYGLYSRHGDFFKNKFSSMLSSSFHLLPDYNITMLFYNL